jgi:acyl-CoA thioester hydrolase
MTRTDAESPHQFTYHCLVRWGDLDAQGHVNNAAYVDYLQEARVHFLLSGPPVTSAMLDSGVLVVSHQVEYLRPIGFAARSLEIEVWVDAIGGSRFWIGYEVFDGTELAARARTALVPFDLERGVLRRLTAEEREVLAGHLAPAEPLRPLSRVRSIGNGHRFPLVVRWSDLDSYGHVNNVKFYDYLQEARIALINESVHWPPETVWMVARQDVDYLVPLDFRTEPYEVGTLITAVGNRSFTLAVEIRDPGSGTVYASGGTVVVGSFPLNAAQREALAAFTESGLA